ncbi:type II secretion system F family protein [Sulfuracidifex tepidarius]|uniref:Type II secretion system protein GspF domain-containing protein n=1 Tax=Sulfuracidifex tepidarius TaxID=1294262 RepID=A0A510E043_9CREN|nr:type II secretion system F family protein [Sulfuracidifex tepidarius]BBG23116.1 hypothetical protein IC006_0400 [Sulfuracidifex tepidarius]BBG25866.1 hypothetical protein IC007_0371 [Sulfuracidifex tepidarius]
MKQRREDPFMEIEFGFYLMSRSPLFVASMALLVASLFMALFPYMRLSLPFFLPYYELFLVAGSVLLAGSALTKPWRKGKRYHGTKGEVLGKVIFGRERFNSLVRSYMSKVERDMTLSSENDNSLSFVSDFVGRSISYTLLCGGIDAVSVLSLLIARLPLFSLLLVQAIWIVPFLMYEYPAIYYRGKSKKESKDVSYELPFFVFLSSVASSSGLNLSYVYKRIYEKSVFRGFGRESKAFIREMRNHGKSLIQFVDYRARVHPLKEYASFLYAYSSVFRAGGGIQDYLNDKAKEFVNVLNFRWSFYADRISSVGETIIISFLVFPTLFLVLSIFGGISLLYLLILMPPFFMVALYAMVREWRPKTFDDLSFNSTVPLALGVMSFLVGVISHAPLFVDVYVSLVIASISMYLQVKNKISEVRNVEDNLPQFLRDLTEYRKIGYNVNKSLVKVSLSESYTGRFKEILGKASSQVKSGIPLNEVSISSSSWMGKFTFFMLGLISESGNVSTMLLEELNDFTRKYVEYKREALSRIRMYQFLGVMTPILLTFVVLITTVLLSSFGGYLTGVSPTISTTGVYTFQGVHISQELKELMYVFIELSSFFVGLILGKASSGTIANTVISIVGLTLALVGILAFTYVEPSIARLFMP